MAAACEAFGIGCPNACGGAGYQNCRNLTHFGLFFSVVDPIFMTIIMIGFKYDGHHVNVNGQLGVFWK
ncbi:hypothetical protein AGR4B_Lc10065 [Agrobacterium tumefaciens str. CFBP 5621]|nr:hypothetical protein AGR4B_Lc10065 [Agrobacterium tumefaciens str. CFBP 5621]